MLKISNVTMTYDNVVAVDNVSFEVKKGDYVCIVGSNGSGKTTLISGILGLNRIKEGQIEFAGMSRNEIGYLPQQSVVQKDFPANVFEVVISGCLSKRGFFPFYSSKEKGLVMENLEKLSILDLKNKCYQELSGGQQQRVLLARALCATKKLLVLDEPVSGLDPTAANDFYKLIKDLNKRDKIAIIMITHDVKVALYYSNKILHMGHFWGKTEDYTRTKLAQNLGI